jgi:alpha-tubulin suppressor-like RCC1 family protein
VDQIRPMAVAGLPTVQSISTGFGHACAVSRDNFAWCWGDNTLGQAGGTAAQCPSPGGPSPCLPSPATVGPPGVMTIAAGGDHTCAVLMSNGAVYCWGDNSYGQLATGAPGPPAGPVQSYAFPPAYFGGISLSLDSPGHTCLLESNTIGCWGADDYSESGPQSACGTTQCNPTFAVVRPNYDPANPLSFGSVASGRGFTCAVTLAGTVFCWGLNSSGQLGDGTVMNRPPTMAPNPLNGIASLSAGSAHVCALNMSGAVYCWGLNGQGQCGSGPTHQMTPTQIGNLPPVTAVAAAATSTCAIANHTIYCWGDNSSGQLGDGTHMSRVAPMPVMW